MKKTLKFIPVLLIMTILIYFAGFNFGNIFSPMTWLTVTLQQINYKPNDSLLAGKTSSDYLGDSVEFVCRVIAPPRVSPAHNDMRPLIRGCNSWTCFAQDTAGNVWGGITIRQSSRNMNLGLDLLDTGALIKVRGTVTEFPVPYNNALTQLAIDTGAGYTITVLSAAGNRPVPKIVNISEFAVGDYTNGGTVNLIGGRKYVGMYVEFRNVTVGAGIGSRQPFSIVDSVGNKLYMRDFSNWFTTSTGSGCPNDTLRTWTPPSIGTYINYIKGVVIIANNEGAFGTLLPFAICPIYPNDMSIGNAPPALSTPTRTPGVPTPSDSVLVTVTVTDPGFSPVSVSDVRVFWRTNGGAYNQKQMNATGNIYSTKMPPYSLGTLVEYFFKATDNQNASKLLPTDTAVSKMFYLVKANDSLSIQDVQWCPNRGGYSGYNGAYVRGIEGICTSDTADIRAFSFSSSGGSQTSPRRVIIQNGQGAWSGIWLYNNATDVIHRGDRVRVRGTVEENFSVTRINVATAGDIQIISTGNALPTPENLSCSVLANNKIDGDTTVEKWESVFVRINTPSWISCINAQTGITCLNQNPPLPDSSFRRNYGEILVRDISNGDARIELQDGNHTFTNNWDGVTAGKTLLTKNDSISFLQGILYFSFSNYKLVPRRNFDFGTVTPVGIGNNEEHVMKYQLFQNYPNPFNPKTNIRFSVPELADVKIVIYDLLGKEIQVLSNKQYSTGSYILTIDGSNLSSGIYFYRMIAYTGSGKMFTETKKMVLIK